MEKQIVAILLLDTTSRKQLKTNISEIGLQGVLIVNNFNEITEDIVSKCNKVVVLEGYLDSLNSFSDIRLFSALLNIKLTFIGTNPDKLKVLSQYGNVFNSDAYSNVEGKYDMIITNPPIHAGKEKIYEIVRESANHLNKDGELWIVIRKDQGAKSLINDNSDLFDFEIVNKIKGFWIIKSKIK